MTKSLPVSGSDFVEVEPRELVRPYGGIGPALNDVSDLGGNGTQLMFTLGGGETSASIFI